MKRLIEFTRLFSILKREKYSWHKIVILLYSVRGVNNFVSRLVVKSTHFNLSTGELADAQENVIILLLLSNIPVL